MSSSPSPFIDLHSHTVYSPDGWEEPETLVRTAAARGTTLLSITDHNHLGAQVRARAEAARIGLPYLTGVELDLLMPETGAQYHYLAFGFDPEHEAMTALIERQLGVYERSCREMLEGFARLGPSIDEDALRAAMLPRYHGNPTPQLTYWWVQEWAVETGAFPDRKAFEERVAHIRTGLPPLTPEKNYATVPEAIEAVHAAGGVLLLAHVARYFPRKPWEQVSLITMLREMGLDGFELHHPMNLADPALPELEATARRSGCLLSCGSDTHRLARKNDEALFGRMPVPEWVCGRLPGPR